VVFVESRISLLDKYKEVKAKEIEIPVIQVENTDTIDSKLTELKIRRDSADKNNQLVARYGYWNTWIEAKGLYEKEIDILRKLYGKVNTGVSGLIISPEITNSGRVEIWLKYDGKYDPDFFGNTTGDHRYLFEYSAFQRSIIGLLLQASRLDMKDKVLRMAFVDDISVTKKSIEMIERVCGEKSKTMNYLIVLCIVLAAVAVFQATKVARYSKNLKEAGEAILIKNEAINELRHGKNLLNANIADLKMKNNSLREQVSLLVSEVNKIGVKRNEKGQFVSLD
jgi:hypothetical protein